MVNLEVKEMGKEKTSSILIKKKKSWKKGAPANFDQISSTPPSLQI